MFNLNLQNSTPYLIYIRCACDDMLSFKKAVKVFCWEGGQKRQHRTCVNSGRVCVVTVAGLARSCLKLAIFKVAIEHISSTVDQAMAGCA